MAEIIVDEKTRQGKPTIKGTRITVDEVLGMLENGMTYNEVKKEYGLTKEQVLAVIRYTSSLVRGEGVEKRLTEARKTPKSEYIPHEELKKRILK